MRRLTPRYRRASLLGLQEGFKNGFQNGAELGGQFWRHFGGLGGPWSPLGPSWRHLKASWRRLGTSETFKTPLGRLLGPILGHFSASWRRLQGPRPPKNFAKTAQDASKMLPRQPKIRFSATKIGENEILEVG